MNLIQQALYRDERPLSSVPSKVILILFVTFFLQIVWILNKPEMIVSEKPMPVPPSERSVKLLSLNAPLVASKITMLWLQAFDNQANISIPFARLDYDLLIAWLELCLRLDPLSQYPLLAASRLYTLIDDEVKVRKMNQFTYDKFLEDPVRRWPWIAHAIYVAKHRLEDLDTALEYARALRLNTVEGQAPYWARHMEVYITEDLGDIEATKILIGGLLESGAVTDENEIRFLRNRLEEIEEK
jgi:hypothetical protein